MINVDDRIEGTFLSSEKQWIKLLSLLLGFIFLAKILVAFKYEINWDEFYYLSFVYKYLQGDLTNSLQTFHVHFFSWLSFVSVNEVNQIISARFVMLLLNLITGFLIYQISRRYMGVSSALFSVVSYFSLSYIMKTGTSFRVDPLATLCMIASLNILLTKNRNVVNTILSGFIFSLSLMVTIKSAIYLPVILIFFIACLLFDSDNRIIIKHILLFGFTTIVSFFLLFYFHQNSIDEGAVKTGVAVASSGFEKTLAHGEFFPRRDFFVYSLIFDVTFWSTLIYGLLILLTSVDRHDANSKKKATVILAMTIPLCSVFFYRNAYPYYYLFMLAPACLLCGIAWDSIIKNEKSKIPYFILVFILISVMVNGFLKPLRKNSDQQYVLIDMIHKAFPEPVPYIDRCSMVSSFPQVGFFMSSWGIESYFAKGNLQLTNNISDFKPRFIIANINVLELNSNLSLENNELEMFLSKEREVLKENYIYHWGGVYVAGKNIDLDSDNVAKTFSIIIDGIYTLEAKANAKINGEIIEPGNAIYLDSGEHSIESMKGNGRFTLRWGKQLYKPDIVLEEKDIFNGF